VVSADALGVPCAPTWSKFSVDLWALAKRISTDFPVIFAAPPGGWQTTKIIGYGVGAQTQGHAVSRVYGRGLQLSATP
jgi:hypothetical protein